MQMMCVNLLNCAAQITKLFSSATAYNKYYASLDGMRVKHIITLGSPWQGSSMIKYLKYFQKLSTRHHEMSVDSSVLKDLREYTCAQTARVATKFICVGSRADIHVPYPASLLTFPHVKNLTVRG